ncbi:hypothetical protein ACHAPU_005408 [Fusarium lateritium]
MGASQEPESTFGALRKRRALSISPSQERKPKRTCHPQSCEALNDHQIYQPTPKSVTPRHVNYIEELVAAQEHNHPFEQVKNWLQEVYPFELREKSRSDGFLCNQYDTSVFYIQTQSAPPVMFGNMMHLNRRGGAVPSYLTAGSRASTPGTQSEMVGSFDAPTTTNTPNRSYGSLVENPRYKDMNLAQNNIFIRDARTQLPSHISALVRSLTPDRVSTLPPPEEVEDNNDLFAMEIEASEAKVDNFFRTYITPISSQDDVIWRSDRVFVCKDAMPPTLPSFKLSTPVPDMLYGYNHFNAFDLEHRNEIATTGNAAFANNEGLMYPFFAVEFKGDGPSSRGSLWVATNQCLGMSTACVNIAEKLNERLGKCEFVPIRQINSASFSIVMNGTEARLHVS